MKSVGVQLFFIICNSFQMVSEFRNKELSLYSERKCFEIGEVEGLLTYVTGISFLCL